MQRKSKTFTTRDFLENDNFVSQYINSKVTPTNFLNDWLIKYPENHNELKQAINTIDLAMSSLQGYTETIITEEAIENLLERILMTNSQIK